MKQAYGLSCALILSLFVLMGCQSEDSAGLSGITKLENGLFKANFEGDLLPELAITSIEAIDENDLTVDLRSDYNLGLAWYNTRGGHKVRVSAIAYDEQVYGKGRVNGPVYIHLEMDTRCIEVVGNRATIAGEVTEIDLGDNPNGIPLEKGWLFYLAIEDNGRGHQGDKDRYNATHYYGMPGFGIFCDVLTPDNPAFWPDEEWIDVQGKWDAIRIK